MLVAGRLCNNYRFLDRETTWVIAHVVEPLRDRPADLLFNLVIFRCYLNWHASMSLLGLQRCEGFDCAVFDAKLREVGTALGKLSSAAYNVGSFHAFQEADRCMPSDCEGVKPTRAAAMFGHLAPQMASVMESVLQRKDPTFTFKTITSLRGVGRFLGWQVCLDLGYWNPAVYNESIHVEVGPGAAEGLAWLFQDTGGLSAVECVKHLDKVQTAWFDKIGVDAAQRELLFGSMPAPPTQQGAAKPTGPLNLMAIEGCLCEGNKYFRVHYNDGSGRFKCKYTPHKGADERYLADYAAMQRLLKERWEDTTVGSSPTPAGVEAVGVQAADLIPRPPPEPRPAAEADSRPAKRPRPPGPRSHRCEACAEAYHRCAACRAAYVKGKPSASPTTPVAVAAPEVAETRPRPSGGQAAAKRPRQDWTKVFQVGSRVMVPATSASKAESSGLGRIVDAGHGFFHVRLDSGGGTVRRRGGGLRSCVEVSFSQPGSLGLHIADGTGADRRVVVLSVQPGSQAEEHPEVVPGLPLESIASVAVDGLSYTEVTKIIGEHTDRPLTVTFGRLEHPGGGAEAASAAAPQARDAASETPVASTSVQLSSPPEVSTESPESPSEQQSVPTTPAQTLDPEKLEPEAVVAPPTKDQDEQVHTVVKADASKLEQVEQTQHVEQAEQAEQAQQVEQVDQVEQRFAVGARVRCLYPPDGGSYPATVTDFDSTGGGVYTVQWDDGDTEHRERPQADVWPLTDSPAGPQAPVSMPAGAVSITLDGDGAIGLVLRERAGKVFIDKIVANSLASELRAGGMSALRPGLILRSYQPDGAEQQSADNSGPGYLEAMLEVAARPLQLGFEVDEEYQPDDPPPPASAEPKLPSLPPFPTTLRRQPFTIAPRGAQGPTRQAESPRRPEESRPRSGRRARNAPKPARFREPEDL